MLLGISSQSYCSLEHNYGKGFHSFYSSFERGNRRSLNHLLSYVPLSLQAYLDSIKRVAETHRPNSSHCSSKKLLHSIILLLSSFVFFVFGFAALVGYCVGLMNASAVNQTQNVLHNKNNRFEDVDDQA